MIEYSIVIVNSLSIQLIANQLNIQLIANQLKINRMFNQLIINWISSYELGRFREKNVGIYAKGSVTGVKSSSKKSDRELENRKSEAK